MTYDPRGRPLRTKGRPGKRDPSGVSRKPRKETPKARSVAYKRARRRHFMARRLGFLLVLAFLLLGVLYYGGPSSESGYVRAVSPVEAGVSRIVDQLFS